MAMITIRSASDARALLRQSAIHRRTVLVRNPHIPADQLLQWELDLNRHLRDCGCSLGAVFVLLTFAVWLVLLLAQLPSSFADWFWMLARMIVLVALGGGLGKIAGLARARFSILTIIRRMHVLEARACPRSS
jgi:hypothetical protein